jgi:WhiB family redox-sensing transcriptional regulator
MTADWRARAACLDEDPELFFPIGSTGRDYDQQVEEAKAVCRGCLVRIECLDWAYRTRADGIYGGTTEQERAAMRRRHNRKKQPIQRSCDNCGGVYQPGSNNARYCRPCAHTVHKQQQKASEKARRVA